MSGPQQAIRHGIVSALCFVVAGSVAAAQTVSEKRELSRDQREDLRHLIEMVEAVETSDQPGGDAWLKLDYHFLKGSGNKTYVPFTVIIDDAPTGFDAVGMYIKVVEPGIPTDESQLESDDTTGVGPGQLPVSVPEQQFVRPGVPTAGSAAANLVMLEASLTPRRARRPPFEDVHFAKPSRMDGTNARFVQRALDIEPGTYDVYIAVREDGRNNSRGDGPRGAVLKQRVVIADLASDTVTTSSVILTDEVRVLDAPYSSAEQVEHPYALGNVEIAPGRDNWFRQDEELSLVFLIYSMASRDGVPDVSIRYRFYKVGLTDELASAGQPMNVNADTLPPRFNLEAAGNQLPITYAVPLTTFAPGPYRLEVLVEDNIADTRVTRSVQFIVEGAVD